MMRLKRLTSFFLLSAALAGCSSLPPIDASRLPTSPDTFRSSSSSDGSAIIHGPAGPAWWSVFSDPVLDDLITRAEERNDTIAIAVADLDRARALAGSARADETPQMFVGARVARGDGIGGQPVPFQPGPNSLGRFGADLAYEVDLYGRLSQNSRAAALDARSQAELLRSARLLIQAEVATTYFALRAADDELGVLDETVLNYRQSAALTRMQVREGERAGFELDRIQGDLSRVEGEAQALHRRRQALANALAVLVGEPASTFTIASQPRLATPPAVPPGIPSAMLGRRPDIAAAYEAMLAAQARVGVAQALRFPSLSLTANGGRASSDLGALLASGAQAWSIAGLLTFPLFDGGRRAKDIARSQAEFERSFIEYRRSTLTALQEVEDQLSALQTLALERAARETSAEAYERAAAIAQSRYRDGDISQIDFLDAQRNALAARRLTCEVIGAQHQSTASLIRALGGGWSYGDADGGAISQDL